MQLGMIGLGRMGGNMADRLRRGGHDVLGYDPVSPLATVHAELVAALKPPRVVWVMVPAGKITADTIASLGDLLSPGDLVIDGGNSEYAIARVHRDPVLAAVAAGSCPRPGSRPGWYPWLGAGLRRRSLDGRGSDRGTTRPLCCGAMAPRSGAVLSGRAAPGRPMCT